MQDRVALTGNYNKGGAGELGVRPKQVTKLAEELIRGREYK